MSKSRPIIPSQTKVSKRVAEARRREDSLQRTARLGFSYTPRHLSASSTTAPVAEKKSDSASKAPGREAMTAKPKTQPPKPTLATENVTSPEDLMKAEDPKGCCCLPFFNRSGKPQPANPDLIDPLLPRFK